MRGAILPVAILALSILFATPVGGAPSTLRAGSNATYNLSVKVWFSPPFCEFTPSSEVQTNAIACPLIASFPTVNVNGTIGWTATQANATLDLLNVTHSIATYFGINQTHVFKNNGSFLETIFANRTLDLAPFIIPDMDQTLQVATSSMASVAGASNWSSSMDMTSALWLRPSVYTMWWVPVPLVVNQTVKVLTFNTNVTGTTTTGGRAAYTLAYYPALPGLEQDPSASAIPVGDNYPASFIFNYDQTTGLLLNANATIRLGFPEQYQSGCTPSANTKCPLSLNCFIEPSGLNIQATLTLSSSSLIGSAGDSSGSSSGSNGTGSGTGTGGTNGGSSTGGSNGGSNGGTTSGGSNSGTSGGTSGGNGGSGGTNGGSGGTNSGSSGSNGGNGAGANGGSNPGGTLATKPPSSFPWIYVLLGVLAAGIIGGGAYYARNRKAKTVPPTPASQPSA